MKNLTKLFAMLFAVGTISFSCQPENVSPKSDSPNGISADGAEEHPRPAPQCSRSMWYDLKDGSGSSFDAELAQGDPEYISFLDYGSMEMTNDPNSFWFILVFGDPWYTTQERIFVGTLANVPVNALTNTIATEEFATNIPVSPSRNFFQVQIPFTGGDPCKSYVVWSQIHLLDDFGAPWNFKEVWAAGSQFLNGYQISGFCFTPCPTVAQSSPCISTASGACTNLDITMNWGIPPYTVSWWVNGQFLGNGMSYEACPTTSTTYWARCTDSLGNGDTLSFTVCAGSPSCPCAVVSIDPPTIGASCTTILTGMPPASGSNSTCAQLTAAPTGTVTQPLTWQWSNGATTATTSVCQPGTYCVTLTGGNGASAYSCVTINAVNVNCTSGNSGIHKVMVCHKPPGNPANVQNICIDWSGVPAHVAAYRDPNMNPLQGHDSGCMIGPCGNSHCGSH